MVPNLTAWPAPLHYHEFRCEFLVMGHPLPLNILDVFARYLQSRVRFATMYFASFLHYVSQVKVSVSGEVKCLRRTCGDDVVVSLRPATGTPRSAVLGLGGHPNVFAFQNVIPGQYTVQVHQVRLKFDLL